MVWYNGVIICYLNIYLWLTFKFIMSCCVCVVKCIGQFLFMCVDAIDFVIYLGVMCSGTTSG